MGMFDSQGGPDFSLAGMILGGRGYAANWFQQRDQMLWAQAAQAKQDALEKGYMAEMSQSPEYKAFRDQPDSREAALDFWIRNGGAPGDIDTQGASYVGQSLGAQYNKMQSEVNLAHQLTLTNLQDQQQKENAKITHGFNLDETDHRGEVELDTYKKKLEYDDARKSATLKAMQSQNSEWGFTQQVKLTYGDSAVPDGKSAYLDERGQLQLRPASWSTEGQKMMSQITSGENLIDNLTDMSSWVDRGVDARDVQTWNRQVDAMSMTAKGLYESGALDKDSLAVIQSIIPKLQQLSADPNYKYKIKEALRVATIQLQKRNKDVADSFATPVSQLGKERGASKYFPQPDRPPPDVGSVKRSEQQGLLRYDRGQISKPRQELFNAAPLGLGGQ